jgi:hypothetical protein
MDRIVDLSDLKGREEMLKQTLDTMGPGADAVVQGRASDCRWYGEPGVMKRVETEQSRLAAV